MCTGKVNKKDQALSLGQSNQSRGEQSFLLILALKKHAVHNAITSISNSLMQSEIWCYKFRIAFPGAFL